MNRRDTVFWVYALHGSVDVLCPREGELIQLADGRHRVIDVRDIKMIRPDTKTITGPLYGGEKVYIG